MRELVHVQGGQGDKLHYVQHEYFEPCAVSPGRIYDGDAERKCSRWEALRASLAFLLFFSGLRGYRKPRVPSVSQPQELETTRAVQQCLMASRPQQRLCSAMSLFSCCASLMLLGMLPGFCSIIVYVMCFAFECLLFQALCWGFTVHALLYGQFVWKHAIRCKPGRDKPLRFNPSPKPLRFAFLRHCNKCLVPCAQRIAHGRRIRDPRAGCKDFDAIMLPRVFFTLFRFEDPLLGGAQGADATRRRRQEKSDLQMLSKTVAELSRSVATLRKEVKEGNRPGPRRPRINPSNPPSPNSTQAPKLWKQLESLYHAALSSGKTPSDADIRTKLRTLIADPSPPPHNPGGHRNPSKPVVPSDARVRPDPESTFLSMLRSGRASPQPPDAVGKEELRLCKEQWKCHLLLARDIHRYSKTDPAAVLINGPEQLGDVKSWVVANGSRIAVTAVVLDPTGSTDVLVSSGASSTPKVCKATLEHLGKQAEAPKPISLTPATNLNDEKPPEAEQPVTAILRITCSREFSDGKLFLEAKNKPANLPSLILPQACLGKVIRTFAAASYNDEVTALIRVPRDARDQILSASRPIGCFVSPHGDSSNSIVWLPRAKDDAPNDYYKASLAANQKAAGILVYRPGGRANLGILNGKSPTEVHGIPPSWQVTGAPKHWTQDLADDWLQKRFTSVGGVKRIGQTRWLFRGFPREGTGTAVYNSGILITAASKSKHKKTPTAERTDKPKWGPPTAPAAPAAAERPQANTANPNKTEGGTSNERERSRSRGRASNTAASARPPCPHADAFQPTECGGQGDCGFLSIARGLAHLAGETPSDADIAPGGKLQAYLRCEAAKQIRSSTAIAEAFSAVEGGVEKIADEVTMPGRWADSVSLLALAAAIKTELRIWTWEQSLQRWQLYVISPSTVSEMPALPKRGKSKQKIVWLCLQDKHYTWLKPLSVDPSQDKLVPKDAIHQNLAAAASKDVLKGAGRSARSILGLGSASSAAGSTRSSSKGKAEATPNGRSARSLLGLKSLRKASTREVLGLNEPRSDDDVDDQLYRPQEYYRCPCGWLPKEKRDNQKPSPRTSRPALDEVSGHKSSGDP